MKLATWNVNSLTVRLPQVLDWLSVVQPDILCVQEIKQENVKFPHAALLEAGYQSVCFGQKTYNGVAIMSRDAIMDVQWGIPDFDDEQRRVIAATINDLRVVCVYVPNGQAVDSDKYYYKLRWLKALKTWLKTEVCAHKKLALLGDFNIAPEDRDVYDPVAWADQVLCSAPERAALSGLTGLGLSDCFRRFDQTENSYSWWDYRQGGFRRNQGLRIDYILVSQSLAEACIGCRIDLSPRRNERPSDHAPVIAEFT